MKYFGFLAFAVMAVAMAELNIRSAFALRGSDSTMMIHDGRSKESIAMKKFRTSMAENIREQISHKMELASDEFDIEVESLRVEPSLDLTMVKSVQVLGLGTLAGRRMEGLFTLPVTVRMGALEGSEREVQVTGILKVTGPVYTAKANLPRGHVVEHNDLMLTRLPWRGLPGGAFGLASQELVGQRVRSMIGAGNPFVRGMLDEPFAVKTGETIDLTVVSGPGVIIRSRGIAKQEGKLGDMVRVEQPGSKKIISGTVTGQKSVEIRL